MNRELCSFVAKVRGEGGEVLGVEENSVNPKMDFFFVCRVASSSFPQVAHVRLDHPSCSKQHAVLQYKHKEIESEEGDLSFAIL